MLLHLCYRGNLVGESWAGGIHIRHVWRLLISDRSRITVAADGNTDVIASDVIATFGDQNPALFPMAGH